MGETRKLAAIMAVDVVGYSRLMGEDEAGTAKAVREHRKAAAPIVADFGGRVVKTMGDGVLLEFPSVVAAVECAVTLQNMMVERNVDTPEARRIVYRIGVHLGDVLIDGDDILGEGVNIAARLESICEPGGVSLARAMPRRLAISVAPSPSARSLANVGPLDGRRAQRHVRTRCTRVLLPIFKVSSIFQVAPTAALSALFAPRAREAAACG